jgi:hypothetical protein
MKRALAASCTVLALLGALAACAITDPSPYAQGLLQPRFNRAWNNAIDAMKDEGLQVVMADLAAGRLEGRREGVVVTGRVVTQKDGRIDAEFAPGGAGAEDANAAQHVQARWATRMAAEKG